MNKIPNVLVIGTGEYVTGFREDQPTTSDKPAGIILLMLLALKQQNKINSFTLCGQHGSRFPNLRDHWQKCIDSIYQDLDSKSIKTIPNDNETNPDAWKGSIKNMQPGDAVIIATPDHLHFEMAKLALEYKLHVLVVKPLVKSLNENMMLSNLSNDAVCLVEMHKRLDPFYIDAKQQSLNLGEFSYMASYMSQPKSQLDTFKAWAGINSDISYYLNSHHIDIHAWMMQEKARPISVSASFSNGFADKNLNRPIEDIIVLKVDWENIPSGNKGVAVYTASWIAPQAEVHSQQRFLYSGHLGEISVDQAHRGYHITTDNDGLKSPNPLFIQYKPINGQFAGQNTYAFASINQFIETVIWHNNDKKGPKPQCLLPNASEFLTVTAILEAGRICLDQKAPMIHITYDDNNPFIPTGFDTK